MTSKNMKRSKQATDNKHKNAKFIKRSQQMLTCHRKNVILQSKYGHMNPNLLNCASVTIGGKDGNDISYAEELALEFDKQLEESESGVETNQKQNSFQADFNKKTDAEQTEIKNDTSENIKDYFYDHFEYNLRSEDIEQLLNFQKNATRTNIKCEELGNLTFEYLQLHGKENDGTCFLEKTIDLSKSNQSIKLGVKSALTKATSSTSRLQNEVFSILNTYKDLYFSTESFQNKREIQFVYAIHALNHVLKTRRRILTHNEKLKEQDSGGISIPESYRDQGLARAKVLIIVPFRNSALEIINKIISMLFGNASDKQLSKTVLNYKRFVSDYTGNNMYFPQTNRKPEDFEQTFSGNIDDNFRIGLAVTKKSLKLYADVYKSDIIIGSPLGLRLLISNSEGTAKDFDFLSSIEILTIDQTEILMAQNWENLLYILNHMHLQPQSLRDTNINRVRSWCLNGHAKFYRQTLLFSSHDLPEFRSLFNKCVNYEGKLRTSNAIVHGDIKNVIVPYPHIFQRFDVANLDTMHDCRFNYFIKEVLPRFQTPSNAHTLIYIPSYFDYVRLRNYFKLQGISFVQICEYSKKEKIARARDIFFHSGVQFMLYSERAHFYRRTRIKGIRHVVLYETPSFPHFYSEIVNLMSDANQNNQDGLQETMNVTALYSKYDILRLNYVLGTENATALINTNCKSFVFNPI